MTQHLLDTPIKVATCNRCGLYVFACQVNGFKVAVGMAPLDAKGVADALMAGRNVYDQLDVAGKPWKLKARTGGSEWPPYGGRKVLASHDCGTRGMNTTGVDVTEVDPPKAPAPYGARGPGINSAPPNYSQPGTNSSRVQDASPSPSNPYVNRLCDTCKQMIGRDVNYVGVSYDGRWVWVQHDYDCRGNLGRGPGSTVDSVMSVRRRK